MTASAVVFLVFYLVSLEPLGVGCDRQRIKSSMQSRSHNKARVLNPINNDSTLLNAEFTFKMQLEGASNSICTTIKYGQILVNTLSNFIGVNHLGPGFLDNVECARRSGDDDWALQFRARLSAPKESDLRHAALRKLETLESQKVATNLIVPSLPTQKSRDSVDEAKLVSEINVVMEDFGCTDFEAINFNADADTDDGSCLYASDPVDVSRGAEFRLQFSGDENTCKNVLHLHELGDTLRQRFAERLTIPWENVRFHPGFRCSNLVGPTSFSWEHASQESALGLLQNGDTAPVRRATTFFFALFNQTEESAVSQNLLELSKDPQQVKDLCLSVLDAYPPSTAESAKQILTKIDSVIPEESLRFKWEAVGCTKPKALNFFSRVTIPMFSMCNFKKPAVKTKHKLEASDEFENKTCNAPSTMTLLNSTWTMGGSEAPDGLSQQIPGACFAISKSRPVLSRVFANLLDIDEIKEENVVFRCGECQRGPCPASSHVVSQVNQENARISQTMNESENDISPMSISYKDGVSESESTTEPDSKMLKEALNDEAAASTEVGVTENDPNYKKNNQIGDSAVQHQKRSHESDKTKVSSEGEGFWERESPHNNGYQQNLACRCHKVQRLTDYTSEEQCVDSWIKEGTCSTAPTSIGIHKTETHPSVSTIGVGADGSQQMSVPKTMQEQGVVTTTTTPNSGNQNIKEQPISTTSSLVTESDTNVPTPAAEQLSNEPTQVSESTPSTPPPVAETMPSTAPPVAEAMSSTPPPVAESMASTAPPVAEAMPSTPPPVAQSASTATTPVADTASTTSSPVSESVPSNSTPEPEIATQQADQTSFVDLSAYGTVKQQVYDSVLAALSTIGDDSCEWEEWIHCDILVRTPLKDIDKVKVKLQNLKDSPDLANTIISMAGKQSSILVDSEVSTVSFETNHDTFLEGCMDSKDKNYVPLASCPCKSCCNPIYGCMEEGAENYNPDATHASECVLSTPTGLGIEDTQPPAVQVRNAIKQSSGGKIRVVVETSEPGKVDCSAFPWPSNLAADLYYVVADKNRAEHVSMVVEKKQNMPAVLYLEIPHINWVSPADKWDVYCAAVDEAGNTTPSEQIILTKNTVDSRNTE
eukprot:GHVL01044793.1.p1 GENE.GHVL01044793.1~~GHVL01044793.1.p1  ORF type:complete len:1107 (+),score=218.51 GHVL01044793.1:86-3406(+)